MKQASNPIAQSFQLIQKEYLLYETGPYQCFVIPGDMLGVLLLEIGRIRELVFRKSLHGSGKEHDLDGLDRFYHHVIIWDNEQNQIMGGYRFRTNQDWDSEKIAEQSYIEKCYPGIYKHLSKKHLFIELGRSFINEDYQNDIFSLFLLWKGVLLYITTYLKDHRLIVGLPWVKLDHLKKDSISFLLSVLSNNHFYQPISQINAKHPYPMKHLLSTKLANLAQEHSDMTSTFNTIYSIEGTKRCLPVLLKQYINLMGAKTHGFSIARDFNNLLEVLMSTDLSKIPSRRIERYVNR
ncbi:MULTISPECIES: GNAT family N-acetyltransferase [unclassified Legionella]|uniref:GNAT family N-acetyltransferase n=1 Tax=unclassified Legionella TaxID=2622702 RepID=UPI00105522B5|nr:MULTISPECIES: GNAT family N-acetyltransferase [unclassified Legionella]MDI9818570.1 GNAT family N-acetyltransferase [Legionella sp. PL877]